MNNPFDYTPDVASEAAFRVLIDRLEALKRSPRAEDMDFCRELGEGKMLGVLIAEDDNGESHALYAFSGQLGSGEFHHDGFVDPVFDYLQPDGHFKRKEEEISRQNIEISRFEEEDFRRIKDAYLKARRLAEAEVEEFRKKCRQSKLERNAKRESGSVSGDDLEAMRRQSQFEKAELHRLKKRVAADLEPLETEFRNARNHLDALKERRRSDSEALQKWLFSNFRLLNARGESRSLSEIFAATPMRIPPSGAGECCGPKLLQAAYLRGWKPVSMAEYWYGKPKDGEVRIHGSFYPACRGKCLPVLSWMLQGLEVTPPLEDDCLRQGGGEPEIIYENRWFCVVSKPGGLLSVPGKGAALSVEEWLVERYGPERQIRMAHRLDQDTSGLIIATFGELSLKVIQRLFAMRRVKKTYIAELDGDYVAAGLPRQGHIALPLSADWLDRPRQKVDFSGGKEAETDYEFEGVSAGRSRIKFHPITGRTHQLRVHAASEMGLGMPIVGDRLYGKNKVNGVERLHLHAQKIEFTFPIDGHHYSFTSPSPF